jgi:hypothetical protein
MGCRLPETPAPNRGGTAAHQRSSSGQNTHKGQQCGERCQSPCGEAVACFDLDQTCCACFNSRSLHNTSGPSRMRSEPSHGNRRSAEYAFRIYLGYGASVLPTNRQTTDNRLSKVTSFVQEAHMYVQASLRPVHLWGTNQICSGLILPRRALPQLPPPSQPAGCKKEGRSRSETILRGRAARAVLTRGAPSVSTKTRLA